MANRLAFGNGRSRSAYEEVAKAIPPAKRTFAARLHRLRSEPFHPHIHRRGRDAFVIELPANRYAIETAIIAVVVSQAPVQRSATHASQRKSASPALSA